MTDYRAKMAEAATAYREARDLADLEAVLGPTETEEPPPEAAPKVDPLAWPDSHRLDGRTGGAAVALPRMAPRGAGAAKCSGGSRGFRAWTGRR